MIGDMIAKARIEKGMTKTELANLTGINIGHLSHIEKGERNPSHKALRNICKALDIPYQQMMYTYDKFLNEDQESYGFINYLTYNKLLAVDNLNNFIDCPSSKATASIAVKMFDDSMVPSFKRGDYLFIEFNSVLNNGDIGLFYINNSFYFRKFTNQKDKIILKADNKEYPSITIKTDDDFYIVGKVLGKK